MVIEPPARLAASIFSHGSPPFPTRRFGIHQFADWGILTNHSPQKCRAQGKNAGKSACKSLVPVKNHGRRLRRLQAGNQMVNLSHNMKTFNALV